MPLPSGALLRSHWSIWFICYNYEDLHGSFVCKKNKNKIVLLRFLFLISCHVPAAPQSTCEPADKYYKCNSIVDLSGPFGPCLVMIGFNTAKAYEIDCRFDLEQTNCDETYVCSILAAFATVCRNAGVPVQWRNTSNCRKNFDVIITNAIQSLRLRCVGITQTYKL